MLVIGVSPCALASEPDGVWDVVHHITCPPVRGMLWDEGKYGSYVLAWGLMWFICYREQSWAAGNVSSLRGLNNIVEFWEEWWLFSLQFWNSCKLSNGICHMSHSRVELRSYWAINPLSGPGQNLAHRRFSLNTWVDKRETLAGNRAYTLLSCLSLATCLPLGRLNYLFFVYL